MQRFYAVFDCSFFSFALQTNTLRERLISINKPIISQLSLRALEQVITLSEIENTWEKMNQILATWAVVRTTFIISKACNKVKMRNSLQYRLVVGMHSVNLVTNEFWRCLKGKFLCSVVLLFYLERISIGYLEPRAIFSFCVALLFSKVMLFRVI